MNYIVTRDAHKSFNYDKTEEFEVEKIALFYFKPIGKHRFYRRGINIQDDKFILYIFKEKEKAQKQADFLNKDLLHEVKFKVEIYENK